MDLILAGLILPNVQNHSLGRLAAATRAGGFTAEIIPFRGFPDVDPVTDTVTRVGPRVFGVSLQTTESALASVILVEMLRRRGFRGVIVAGGHFATLNAQGLMREVAALDVVVRFAGEAALLSLLKEGASPRVLASMPGTIYRDRDGAVKSGAPPMIDSPIRTAAGDFGDALPVHLGFPAADIVASRGCEAHCAYCCVAGASDIAEAHGARYTRTAETTLADAIGALYHERGARVFNFMDDNLLPMVPGEAFVWLQTFSSALRERGVGQIAFSLQLRADVCAPEVVAALVKIGLCRAYVGIDGYSGRQLAALGRDAPSDAGPVALGRLASAGVFSVCNALIIGPTFSFTSILREIDALADVREAPVHLLPVDVRAGSKYFERVRSRGLLEGGLLWRRYRFADSRTAKLAEAITSFPTRLEEHSVPIALYDLGYNLGIARRLVAEADTDEQVPELYKSVTARWNADQSSQQRLEPRDGAGELPALDASAGGVDSLSPVDATDGPAVCGEGAWVPVSPGVSFPASVCYCSIPASVDVTFDSTGVPLEVSLPDGGTVPDAVRSCVLRSIGTYCFPSLAGTSQPLTGAHCWIA